MHIMNGLSLKVSSLALLLNNLHLCHHLVSIFMIFGVDKIWTG